MAKKLKVRKVIADQTDQEVVIDDSELLEDEELEDEEGEGDDPIVPDKVDDQADGSSSLGGVANKLPENNLEGLEAHEEDLITLIHTVESGTLILASRAYKIVDYEVKILAEDFQACIHHGLVQKE